MSSFVGWLERPVRFGVLAVVGLALLAAAFAAGLGISGTFATHVDPNEHHACVSKYTGAMRYVVDPAKCTPYENLVNWIGVDAAAPDVNFYRVTSGNVAGDIAGRNLQHTLTCDATTDTAVSGGFFLRNDWNVIKSQQDPANEDAWLFHAQAIDVPTARATTFAQFEIVCAVGTNVP